MNLNKYVDVDESDSESDDEIDIHEIARSGSLSDLEWALLKDKTFYCFHKDEVCVYFDNQCFHVIIYLLYDIVGSCCFALHC